MSRKNILGIVMLKAIILNTLLSLTFGCLQTDKEVSIQRQVTGINDAPAMAVSDFGIAMGAIGR